MTPPPPRPLSRREFLLASAASAATAATVVTTGACGGRALASASPSPARAPRTVLFQGDSITDAGRNRNNAAPNAGNALGNGYPLLVASAVLRATPDASWRFFNRGISGNKVPDLQARWDADAIALAPDVLSILIGVNDYWHKRGGQYGGTVAQYESQYTSLLESTRRALPSTRLVVLEPFVLRVGAVDATWFPEFDERRAVAAKVARAAGATFIPLHSAFEEAASRTGPAYWAADGVHPTPAGHALIADLWRRAVGV